MSLQIRSFVAPGFAENGYIVWKDGTSEAVAIDPGNTASAIIAFLREHDLELKAVLLTHAHLDHIEGVAELVEETAAPVHLHPADRFLYDNASQQARQFGMRVAPPPALTSDLEHGQVVELGDAEYHVRHVPGHSPGHVLFYVPTDDCAFVGDVVFQGSIGRTDLPGGDFGQLMQSIRDRVLDLPDSTTLYTGHGPPTTVGHERATNPFLVPHYGGGLA